MKKLVLLLLAIGLFACQSDDDPPVEKPKPAHVFIGYSKYLDLGMEDCKAKKKPLSGQLEGRFFDDYITGWEYAGCDSKNIKPKFIDPRYKLPHAFRSNKYNLLPIGYAKMSLDKQAKNIFIGFSKKNDVRRQRGYNHQKISISFL